MRFIHASALLSMIAMSWLCPLPSSGGTINEKNLRFVDYPDFPDAHSTWGSIGYSSTHGKVFIGVTNHRDREGLYEYDVRTKTMRLCGFIDELGNLRDFQWQGKIHSKIVEGPDGAMYFSTDGGESREEYLMNHPRGMEGASSSSGTRR